MNAGTAKLALRGVLSHTSVSWLWRHATAGLTPVFMLHRFEVPGLPFTGDSPEAVRSALACLRKDGYDMISLREAVRRLLDGQPAQPRSVVFTIDDGYADFAVAGAAIFAEYDCPVTVFVTTGFVDGVIWNWWDKIEFVLLTTKRQRIAIEVDGGRRTYELASMPQRRAAVEELQEYVQHVPDSVCQQIIRSLADVGEVDLPERAPAQYSAMTWREIATLEGRGIEFGPHSVTHRVLNQISAEDSDFEIRESWHALQRHVARPVPIFAYPNGLFGPRESISVERQGMLAAVTTQEGHVGSEGAAIADRFQLPRYGFSAETARVRAIACGLTHLAGLGRELLPGPLAGAQRRARAVRSTG